MWSRLRRVLLLRWAQFLEFWGVGEQPHLPMPRNWRPREVDHLLDQMGKRLGFSRSDDGPVTLLRGIRGELSVEVTVRRIPWAGQQTRFEQSVRVQAQRAFAPTPLRLEPRPKNSAGVRTRDASFDRDMVVYGDEATCLALMSSAARATVMGSGGTWTMSEAELTWTAHRAPNFLAASTERVMELVETTLSLEGDVIAGLCHRVRHDPNPHVRRRAFAVLWSKYSADARAQDTARAATQDRLPVLRMEAAVALGDEGRTTLIELLCAKSTPHGLRSAVANHLPVNDREVEMQLKFLVEESLDLELKRVGVEFLGRLGGPETVGYLEPLTFRFGSGVKLRKIAREAHARVLTRYAHVGTGQLAVVEDDDSGALSEV